jgi:glycosyltransferase involved in cell wall biosynthesis
MGIVTKPADILIVTNVPTPYRVHLFNEMSAELERAGLALEVCFMAGKHRRHTLHLDLPAQRFRNRVFAGLQLYIGGRPFHLNLGLVAHVLRSKPSVLMIGGWCDVTTALLFWIVPLVSRRSKIVLWAEANRNSQQFSRGIVQWFRRRTVDRCNLFALPGVIAIETVFECWGAKHKPVIPLPNIVDEREFRDGVESRRHRWSETRRRFGIPESKRVVLFAGRLLDAEKGILSFAKATADDWPSDLLLCVVGTGPDSSRLEDWVRSKNLSHVILLGHSRRDALLDLYAAADVFLLPSFIDPNPLVVIEALWARLPIALSSRCGNGPEAVQEGVNGWTFDPYSKTEMVDVVRKIAGASTTHLTHMGSESLRIAEAKFSTTKVVTRFCSSISAIIKQGSGEQV